MYRFADKKAIMWPMRLKLYRGLYLMYRWLLILMGLGVGADRACADVPRPWQLYFQEAVTPVMEKIVHFHDILMIIIVCIGVFVFALLAYVLYRFSAKRNPVPSKFTHNTALEIVWTGIPVLILLALVWPSMHLLYFMDKATNAEMTIKVAGRQWYWHYNYEGQHIEFDSVMIPDKDIGPGQRRLLEVDHPVVIPVDTTVRLLFTADDVLHSWAVPAFGVKQDTVPGRQAEAWVRVTKEGTYYGQCSELCGQGHAFMPICVKVVSKEAYAQWLGQAKQQFVAFDDKASTLLAHLKLDTTLRKG